MDLEPILSPRKKKSPPQEKFSSEEDETRDAASSRTASLTHYQRAIPAPAGVLRTENTRNNHIADKRTSRTASWPMTTASSSFVCNFIVLLQIYDGDNLIFQPFLASIFY